MARAGDGVDQNVQITRQTSIEAFTAFSMSVYAYIATAQSGLAWIAGKKETTTFEVDYGVQFDGSKVRANIRTSTATTALNIDSSPPRDTWKHYGMTWDGTTLRGFAGGTFAASASNSGTLQDDADDFYILDRDNFNLPLDGAVAEVALWDRALSDEEMQTAALRVLFVPDLVLYVPLYGRTEASYEGSDFAITLNNGPTATDHPFVGPTFSYDSWIQLPEAAAAPAGHPTMRRWGQVPGMGLSLPQIGRAG